MLWRDSQHSALTLHSQLCSPTAHPFGAVSHPPPHSLSSVFERLLQTIAVQREFNLLKFNSILIKEVMVEKLAVWTGRIKKINNLK